MLESNSQGMIYIIHIVFPQRCSGRGQILDMRCSTVSKTQVLMAAFNFVWDTHVHTRLRR